MMAMAIESGLDPDLWGYERAFELFVQLLELRYKREHSGICKKIAAELVEESNNTDSRYIRHVLRGQASKLKYASRLIDKKSPPSKGG